ncbi:MAG: hypothetical protein IOC39_24210 [Burkholderia sp.]|jgi:hypothetical protein|uniref:hypothetical protein n=1 Tax=Burkholderia sp. TaxID=36773 RepID=UPI00258F6680|nr:hypothetical protein [Burkholderia sp.]MCA3780133.1 hypothetical protein [Burkholderia sp.]MCA3796255.1 hypothetical protein [Burkholderia sp.]MCA3802910.1 hypothetical protein [Burkholderia sp.]MCA3810861.1 hypothetical protein [Burkholderia sp.]MCA3818925.1 hypothetical protein [Burkholderia sp.]
MAKITDPQPAVVPDVRADATADQQPAAIDPLDAIAQEELDADAALAAKVEQAEADAAEAEMDALVAGYREAMRAAQDIVVSAVPGLKPVWTDDRMDNIGAALARCDAKYGWGGAGKLLSSPLVALGIASFPVAVGTVQYSKAQKAAAQRAALAARAAAAQADVAPGVIGPATRAPAPAAPVAPTARTPNMADAIDAALTQATYAQ